MLTKAHRDKPFLSEYPHLRLLRQDGSTVLASEAFKDKAYVFVYFSAHWCPSCQRFTPLLADFYNAHHVDKNFEILFVSSDRHEGRMLDNFQNRCSNFVRNRTQPSVLSVESQGICKNATDGLRPAGCTNSAPEVVTQDNECCDSLLKRKILLNGASADGLCRRASPSVHQINQKPSCVRSAMSSDDPRVPKPHVPVATGHGNWLALPFNEKKIEQQLSRRFSVSSIPRVVSVSNETSRIVTLEGKAMILRNMDGAGFPWQCEEVNLSRLSCWWWVLLVLVALASYAVWGYR